MSTVIRKKDAHRLVDKRSDKATREELKHDVIGEI